MVHYDHTSNHSMANKTLPALPVIEESGFTESIESAITQEKHSEHLQHILEQYDEYKRIFRNVLIPLLAGDCKKIFTFRVNYLLKKRVWREFELHGCETLEEFADAIVDSMGWAKDHLHGFFIPEGRGSMKYYAYTENGIYAPGMEDDPSPTFKSDQVRIGNIDYEKYPKIGFVFDFGDGHRFDILWKGTRIGAKEQDGSMPKLIDQRGVGPEQYPDIEE